MSATDKAAYELLTEQHTFIVLDTETSPAAGGGAPRVVSVGTVALVNGRPTRAKQRLIDPGEPITNSQIHGITDAQVASAKVKGFADYAPVLTRQLSAPNIVFVAHNANYDLAALRGEYARIGQEIPDVPVIDTMRLPAKLNVDTGRSRSLAKIAEALNISHKNNHRAADDAHTTARVLAALLRTAASAGWVDFDELHRSLGSTTALSVKAVRRRPTVKDDYEPPTPGHLEDHENTVLPETPTPAEFDEWVRVAGDCVESRCHTARYRAEVAAVHGKVLLPRLVALTGRATEPGQGGTLAAMVAEMLPAGSARNRCVGWWKRNRAAFHALPRCAGAQMCPACRIWAVCPLDTLHQTVARIASVALDGPPDATRRLTIAGSSRGARLPDWSQQQMLDVAGYAAWLVADAYEAEGADQRADACVDQAADLGLDLVEPRIALARAARLTNQERFAEAEAVALGCLRNATTDSGFTDLRNWYAGVFVPTVARAQPAPPRVRTLPRQARPLNRHRPNRYKF